MKCSDKYGFGCLFGSNMKRINTKSPGPGAQGAEVFNCWAARLKHKIARRTRPGRSGASFSRIMARVLQVTQNCFFEMLNIGKII